MDDKAISQLAHEIVSQSILGNAEYWLILALIVFVVAFAASWIGSYAAKRGEFAAAKADREKILEQLAENTRTTARINSIVSLGEWSERERRTLRRIKLEELILTAHKAIAWGELESNRLVFSMTDEEPNGPSPLPLVVSLGNLFFPELQSEIAEFDFKAKTYQIVSRQVRSQLLEAREEASRTATGLPGWRENEIRANLAMNEVRERNTSKILEGYSALQAALMRLDASAGTLMAQIIAVAPADDAG
jgi:hypothetical protein